jgi:hypothetical protein
MRIAIFVLATVPSAVFAHDGFHHHPHGIDYGWIIACAVGLVGGYAVSYAKGRGK